MRSAFHQVHLIVNGKRAKKKKTGVSTSTDPANPVWNEAIVFSGLNEKLIENVGLEVSIEHKYFIIKPLDPLPLTFFSLPPYYKIISISLSPLFILCFISTREYG